MKKPKRQLRHCARQSDAARTRRFRTLYGKPKTLTDRYDECSDESIARLLAKPEAELDWGDFNALYRVGVAPATYEEGLYFVPDALAFLRRNPDNDGIHCVADVAWFLSAHPARLEVDGLLGECRAEVLALLAELTNRFDVIHWDREMNRAKGYDRDHFDYVTNSELVCQALEALLRFRTLASWALAFLRTLGQAENDPLKSAWFLECVAESRRWVFFRGKADPPGTTRVSEALCDARPRLRSLWAEFQERGCVHTCPAELAPDQALVERHAQVIRNSGAMYSGHPTYWTNLFSRLALSDLTNPGQSQHSHATSVANGRPSTGTANADQARHQGRPRAHSCRAQGVDSRPLVK